MREGRAFRSVGWGHLRHRSCEEAREDKHGGGLTQWETKLVRFGARDYDPGVGRWVAKDLIGFAGGQENLYVYAGGDPVNFVDPTGTIANILLGAAGGALVGGASSALAAVLRGNDWRSAAWAGAVSGAWTGAGVASFGALSAGALVVNALGAGVGGMVGDLINDDVPDTYGTVSRFATRAGVATVAYWFGGKLGELGAPAGSYTGIAQGMGTSVVVGASLGAWSDYIAELFPAESRTCSLVPTRSQ